MATSRGGRVGIVFVAGLLLAKCGGQTTRSGDDLEVAADSAENGGSENGGSANGGSSDGHADDRSSGESVVSAVSAQAVTSTSSGGDGGSGAGGTDGIGVPGAGAIGVAGSGAFAGTGGGPFGVVTTGGTGAGGEAIDWGGVPVPEGCATSGRHQISSDSCDLVLECSGRQASAGCSLDGSDYRCRCSDAPDSSFRVYSVGPSEACLYAVNACRRSDAFEAQPFDCELTSENYSSDGCNSIRECSRIASVGDVKLSEFIDSDVGCSTGAWGFSCGCSYSLNDVRFEGSDSHGLLPCTDAHDWCSGDNLDLSEERSCSATPELSVSDICTTHLDCQRPVLVSGMEATMFETVTVQCYWDNSGEYLCECPSLGYFSLDAPDLDSACVSAASICAGEQ